MKNLLPVLLLTAASSLAAPLDGYDYGRERAGQICTEASFRDVREACLDRVRNAYYFDQGAVNLCGRLSFVNNKIRCLETIVNRRYLDVDIGECSWKGVDNRIIDCLDRVGSRGAYQ